VGGGGVVVGLGVVGTDGLSGEGRDYIPGRELPMVASLSPRGAAVLSDFFDFNALGILLAMDMFC